MSTIISIGTELEAWMLKAQDLSPVSMSEHVQGLSAGVAAHGLYGLEPGRGSIEEVGFHGGISVASKNLLALHGRLQEFATYNQYTLRCEPVRPGTPPKIDGPEVPNQRYLTLWRACGVEIGSHKRAAHGLAAFNGWAAAQFPMYTAELLYFLKSWLDANASKITSQNPTGTGEHDFSLLLITGRTNPAATLPTSFPYLKPYIGDDIRTGTSVLLAGYPAGFLEGATITTNLYIASAIGTIKEIFTFIEGGGADLVSAPGTILSQKGSSGGAMVRTDTGELLGLVATATVADTTAERDLRAITLRHVNQSMIAQTDKSLSSYLQGDLRAKADAFNATVAPTLSKKLTDVLNAE